MFLFNLFLALLAFLPESLSSVKVKGLDLYQWTSYPTNVPGRGVPDGPLAANGDLGVTIGGPPGSVFGAPGGKPRGYGGIGLYFGKNDYWGFPDAITYHAGFQHFSPGFIVIGLSNVSTPMELKQFNANQNVVDGSLQAHSFDKDGNSIAVGVAVALDPSVVLVNLTVGCATTTAKVMQHTLLNLSISTDTIFGMDVNISKDDQKSTTTLTKSSVKNDGWNEAVLVPCFNNQILYNSHRSFVIEPSNGEIYVMNGTQRLCISSRGQQLVTDQCNKNTKETDEIWKYNITNGKITTSTSCLRAIKVNDVAKCPPNSYYTDATNDGACQSSLYNVTVSPIENCNSKDNDDDKDSIWKYDSTTHYLHSVLFNNKCLAAVPKSISNNIAMVVRVIDLESRKPVAPFMHFNQTDTLYNVTCNAKLQLSVAILSELDVANSDNNENKNNEDNEDVENKNNQHNENNEDNEENARRKKMSLSVSALNAALFFDDRNNVQLSHQHRQLWFATFYNQSSIVLNQSYPILHQFVQSMMYLLRSSMRIGKVSPGLWGPFTVVDFSGWSDQFTLDYNYMATFWSATATNHPELVHEIYNSFIFNTSRLIPLAKERAKLQDWSQGGWPDRLGASVMGMSCGPTKDWDHDYGCPKGFGGFDGMAFVSCTGPFQSMECSFDDGTRFVAGLVATPMVQYYDGTQDQYFLTNELIPYLKDVALFYTNYAISTTNGSNGSHVVEFPYTCAQETCNGGGGNGGKGEEYNSNSDIAYATMAYRKLLEYTSNTKNKTVLKERELWTHALKALPSIPKVIDVQGGNVTVFAEATTRGIKQPVADVNSAYAITHLAAIHPSGAIDSFSTTTSKEDLKVAQNTVDMINRVTSFAPGNGYCLNWPAAARVHEYTSDSHALLMNFSESYKSKVKLNGWPDLSGGGLEEIGAVDAIRMLMVRVVNQVLLLFVGIPSNKLASFVTLRVNGAFLVSANNQKLKIKIKSEVGRTLFVPKNVFNGFSGGSDADQLCKTNSSTTTGVPLNMKDETHYVLDTNVGEDLDVVPC